MTFLGLGGSPLRKGNRSGMAEKRDLVAEQLEELRQDLRDLWVALRIDPKKQARRERAWSIFAGLLGAAATMASRKAATKAWHVLTGEEPPAVRQAQQRVLAERERSPVREVQPTTADMEGRT
jgi:hypothetical protein